MKGARGGVSQEEPAWNQGPAREVASRQGGSAAKGSSAVKLVGRNRIIYTRKGSVVCGVCRRDEAQNLPGSQVSFKKKTS